MRSMVEGAAEVQDKFPKRRSPLHRADARSPSPAFDGGGYQRLGRLSRFARAQAMASS